MTPDRQVVGVLPLVVTFYARDGRMLMRSQPLREGMEVDVPKELRKQVARTETMDATGEIVDSWTVPWATEDGP